MIHFWAQALVSLLVSTHEEDALELKLILNTAKQSWIDSKN